MIYYFSATGNSRFVARQLATRLGDTPIDLVSPEGAKVTAEAIGERLVIVCPVYSWGIPQPVLEWISALPAVHTYCAGVLTCGDDTGLAPKMLAEALGERGITLEACWSIQMPNTYILLPGFDVDSKKVEKEKIARAPERIEQIAAGIRAKECVTDVVAGSMPWLKTAVVYPLFRRWGINTRKFHTTDACSGCGTCARACSRQNITMVDRRPVWGIDCVSCLGCYHICTRHAVAYGRITRHKGQYLMTDTT